MDNRAVGIFDSGLGGLTVVNAMKDALPDESIIYVGDTARMPYGEKDIDTLLTYGRQIIKFLQEKGVKMIIVACGTISSNILEDLRGEFEIPLIGVVQPGIEAALKQAKKRVGVIATATTVRGGYFQRMLKEKTPSLDVEVKACPLFVPLIEEGRNNHIVTTRVVEAYLRDWKENPIDTLILGCTHYPLLSESIRQVLGDIELIDMAVATVSEAAKYLSEKGMKGEGNAIRQFYASDDVGKFNNMAGQITGMPIKAEKIYWE